MGQGLRLRDNVKPISSKGTNSFGQSEIAHKKVRTTALFLRHLTYSKVDFEAAA
jgi:hypothetical protein